jgi:methionyl-tRNA formyltransferase
VNRFEKDMSPSNPLRTVFMGSPELAQSSLIALSKAPDFDLIRVVTLPDARRSRRGKPVATPVGQAALDLELPLTRWGRGDRLAVESLLAEEAPDLIVVIAFARILKPSLLAIPKMGCVNLHASLLPWGRGASPIQQSLLEGLDETGWSAMLMDEGLDTGPVLAKNSCSIEDNWNAGDLSEALAQAAPDFLLESLRAWREGDIVPKTQPDTGATLTRKIPKEAGALDWKKPALDLHRQIRALNPEPGTWCMRDAARLFVIESAPAAAAGLPGEILEAPKGVLRVACEDGALDLLTVKPQGKRPMPAGDYLRGRPLEPGESLEQG